MLPIIYDPVVGLAIEQYSHEYRRPRGVFLSIDHSEQIENSFINFGAGPEDVDLIVVTDAEEILGIGDWGVGGVDISIDKLAVYTVGAGIDPTRVIPVILDVGTNRESLLNDPLYLVIDILEFAENDTIYLLTLLSRLSANSFQGDCCTGRILVLVMEDAY